MKITKGIWFVLLLALTGCKNDNSSSSSDSGSQSSGPSTSENNSKVAKLQFLAINDFHGAISENKDAGEPGIFKLASYIKDVDQKSKASLH